MTNMLSRYGIKEVADVTFYELDNGQPGRPVLVLDTLRMSDIEATAENTDAKGGKGNASLISWDYGKEITINIEDALYSIKSLSLINGGLPKEKDPGEEAERVAVFGILKDTKIWRKNASGVWESLLKEKTLVDKISEQGMKVDGKFLTGSVKMRTMKGLELSPWDNIENAQQQTSLLNNDCFYEKQGEIYLMSGYYLFVVKIQTKNMKEIVITADSFPGTYYIVGDTTIRDEKTGQDRLFQIVIPKAKIMLESSTITMEADGEPSVFGMSLKVLKPEIGPMMYCQDYLDFYGTSVEMRTFFELPNPNLTEEELEVTKEQILEIEEQNGNLVRENGVNYVTRAIPMNSAYSEVRLMSLVDEQQVSVVSSNQTFIDVCDLPSTTAGVKYSDPTVSASKGFSYGAKKAYLEKDVVQVAAETTKKNTAVVEMQRIDGVILSLINVDSASWAFHENGMLKYFKVVLDESDGNVWIAVEISQKGEASFTYWVNYDWLYSDEGYLWIGKMAVRFGMDLITLFNPFGKAASLGARIAMSLGNRFVLRTAIFQLDEGLLKDTEYSELTIDVMNYITGELKKLI